MSTEQLNWEQRIQRAIANPHGFTEEDKSSAKNWRSCAFSEQDPRLKRAHDGTPTDFNLIVLGAHFSGCVASNQVYSALSDLTLIRQRAAAVLIEMEEEQNGRLCDDMGCPNPTSVGE